MADESSVRVAVRIRPQTPAEVVEGCGICARAGGPAGEGGVALGSERAFTFDYAFEPSCCQQAVYDTCVRKLVEAALDGYNATVLAYGQTGSGKTYTMGSGWEGEGDGDEERRGIIPRAIRDLFAGAEARADEARAQGQLPPEFSVQAQFIELYNEDIVDLLDPAKDPFAKGALRITEDGCGGVRIVGASMRAVRGAQEALGALRAGALARTTAATNMNSSSSRSHAVFTLLLRQRRLAPDQDTSVDREADSEAPEQYETLTAKFHFVDLAGSERLKRTGATGERAKEGISINCGLLALGNVISALGDRSRKVLHVPYRDSKLTRLLQDSLGGNSNTVMIACVSPSDRDFMETLNTLKYANRARNIKNRCVVNQDLTSRTIHQLRQEVARLQLELAEYKQGKRVISENGEEGWSDVVQENAILTGEVESLRRRVKAMQGTIEQLSARNSELVAEKALGNWGPKDGSPDTNDCSLTALVQGYVSEIEDLRAQLLESNAMYEASRKREATVARTRHDSVQDPSLIIDDAKRELYKEKELLARSMGELEFQRKLNMSESMTSAVDDRPIGERERAEGESAEDSEPSDGDGEASDSEEEDSEVKGQRVLSAQLAALSEDIDTKARLIEQLELSQRRLAALRTHYEQRLDTLHHQIKATNDEKDKVLASLASQASPPSEKLKRVKEEYERRVGSMSRELKRLQAAAREHTRLQRSQQHAALQLAALRTDLAAMKRDKVKLVQRMREEAKRHAQAEAARAKEVAQLRKESRKNANLIRSLEAETKMKEAVLRRKQEEVSLLRKGHRDKLSSRAAGRLHERAQARKSKGCREAWARLECWVSRAVAARVTLGELEAAMERLLAQRERARDASDPDTLHLLRYLRDAIADTQAQIMQIEEENDENQLPVVLEQVCSAEAGRYSLARLAALTLQHAQDAARHHKLLHDTRAQLAEVRRTHRSITQYYSLARLAALTLQHAQDAARHHKLLHDTRAQLAEVRRTHRSITQYYSLARLAALTLQHAQDAARHHKLLHDTRAQLAEVRRTHRSITQYYSLARLAALTLQHAQDAARHHKLLHDTRAQLAEVRRTHRSITQYYSLARLAALTLQHAQDAARHHKLLHDTRAQLAEVRRTHRSITQYYSLARLAALTLQHAQDAARHHKLLHDTRAQLAEVRRTHRSITQYYSLARLAALTLQHAQDAARHHKLLHDTRAQLAELQEQSERSAAALRLANADQNLNPWGVPAALSALLQHVSSGTSTRSVSPVDSSLLDVRPSNGVRESSTAPTSPPDDNTPSPFQRNTQRRGSVRLRDLGVIGRDEDPMTQSMVEPASPRPIPLSRVPSAPGSLRGLQPLNSGGGVLASPVAVRRPPAPPESPRPPRRQLSKPASLEPSATVGTPPASPGAARRARDDDVFLRLTGAGNDNTPQGVVKEITLKRTSGSGGSGTGAWLQCTHVAEGHAGAALALAATPDLLYSGGVDRTVRGWDFVAGTETWRGWCGGSVGALAAAERLVLAAAGAAVRLFDTRSRTPVTTLWSSGVTGPCPANRGVGGEVAVTALALAQNHRLYTAVGDKLRLWDLRMMECVCKLWTGHAAAVMCLAVGRAAAGDLVATGSKDHYVRTLDMLPQDTGNYEASNRWLLEPPHYDGVQALALSQEDGALYSASRDTSLKRWSLTDHTLTHGVMNAHKGWVTGVCAVRAVDAGLVASCGRDAALRLWSGALRPAAAPAALPDLPHALRAHPAAPALYTAGNDGRIRCWRVRKTR
ncbi:kinesin-like protein KIF21B isoform X2 [Spodoptera litura]|uniref:Kinesin-like protein KIF21B isoform X2 n=1 Tax=Spodoptera litura TaxID=69820 RepID=A0A9J7E4Q4_SPOLT|nr:kinesin-like protein KIF21B isoform X2 [Spodoptera litura]